MIRNYFKLALRNLLKYRFISFINVFGLTVGFTCCLLIVAYVVNEISYDRYNHYADHIYRVERTFMNPANKTASLALGTVAPPVGTLLLNDFKEIKQMTRFLNFGTVPVRYEDKLFNQQNTYFADENLSKVFDVSMIEGNPQKALIDPFSVMLSEEQAKKIFGKEEPMNKVIRLNGQFDCKVTGVYKSFPSNAHLHPEIMISFNTLKDSALYGEKNLRTNWGNNSFYTYILLPDRYNPANLQAQFPAFLDRHMPQKGDGINKPSASSFLTLKKLTDIHLRSHTDLEAEENGDIKRVYIFSVIALFILLIACINYMNLSTARSALRAKEIGIRKVVGARKPELIAQFLSESILLCTVSLVLAILLAWTLMPWLNKLSGQQLALTSLLGWKVLPVLIVVPVVVGAVSGIYPALFLSSFQPVAVLKGLFRAGNRTVNFRKLLVVIQFSISIILIISTAIVFTQLHYMQQKSLGINKDQVVVLPYTTNLNKQYESFKTGILSNSSVKAISRSSRIPSGRLLDAMDSQIDLGDSLAPTKADIKYVVADASFVPAYGVRILTGRNFYADGTPDTTSFLINEAAAKVLGLRSNEEAIGKNFQYGGNKGVIAGVVNDFHFESLHQRILPLVFFEPKNPNFFGNISIKIDAGNIDGALRHIEATWKKYVPEIPYQYNFLEERFTQLYESEQRQGTLFTVFACIAIFIACLGLFGLSAFTITQRIREIGIRKVLGATTAGIVTLLSRDFLKLVAVAALIAFPVGWYAMHQWLDEFAYRVNMPVWVFVLAGIMAAAIALVTISFQAIRAAVANPVKNLRTE
jgi:putative ABC transport system permease protein